MKMLACEDCSLFSRFTRYCGAPKRSHFSQPRMRKTPLTVTIGTHLYTRSRRDEHYELESRRASHIAFESKDTSSEKRETALSHHLAVFHLSFKSTC